MDDEAFNIEAIKCILESTFFLDNVEIFCESALDGQAALDKVKANFELNHFEKIDFHLIFMDSNMPIMDGFESTDNIRRFLRK